ncbi:MAG: hypothetical protein JWM16_6278 [Verrucomicrobiales bacterium]|nr:hypothetical protein [Verrucomicrobiales bacterium]
MNNANLVERICTAVQEALTSDIVSIGEVVQIAKECGIDPVNAEEIIVNIFVNLLGSGVEVGYEFKASEN